jgi:predicted transcriptional regulator YheO
MTNRKQEMLEFFGRLAKVLAGAIGNNCEVVLHDFADPEHSIVAIVNGHVTGREVGDGLDDLGFQVLRRGHWEDMINYRTKGRDGRELRSSSIFLKDEEGKVFGALCINYDLSQFIRTAKFLDELISTREFGIQESFQKNVGQVLDNLIQEAVEQSRKDISEMGREDKISVVAYLESRGAFLIRYSVERVASLLNISKFTIYNYLEEIKHRHAQSEREPV